MHGGLFLGIKKLEVHKGHHHQELREENASPMARAQSLGGREAELRRYLADPRLNIDSNPCENVIRPLCLGRRNWLFAGSGGGGVPMAVLAGLAATCMENGVGVGEWLPDVLPRPDTHPVASIGELLPHEWRSRRDAPAEPAD